MPLLATVSMVAECLRTDCNILGDKKIKMKKVSTNESLHLLNATHTKFVSVRHHVCNV